MRGSFLPGNRHPLNKAASRKRPRLRLDCEELEARVVLSAAASGGAALAPLLAIVAPGQDGSSLTPDAHRGSGAATYLPNPVGYNPGQIRTAYNFPADSPSANGAGQTIAIVDGYNDPNIFQDVDKYDNTFSVNGTQTLLQEYGASSTFLTVVGINANSSPTSPQVIPTSQIATNANWAGEISLDVELAHAIAPAAKIVLVESSAANSVNQMIPAVVYASTQTGASVVSMSFGQGEWSGETALDKYFNVPGVTFVASSGDSGAPPEYPAISPNVLAVGGTTLTLNANYTINQETGWGDGRYSWYYGGSGGGVSAYESRPAYQPTSYSNGTTTVTGVTKRMNPDVAYDANPNTGFAVYDSVVYQNEYGWFEVGGTSDGAPQWAALVALADQGRGGAGSLNGFATVSALYGNPGDFRDITSGNNGYKAGPGYDLVTGLGTPNAQAVLASLESAANPLSPAALRTSGSTSGTAGPAFSPKALLDAADSDGPATFTPAAFAPVGAASLQVQVAGTSGAVLAGTGGGTQVILFGPAEGVGQASLFVPPPLALVPGAPAALTLSSATPAGTPGAAASYLLGAVSGPVGGDTPAAPSAAGVPGGTNLDTDPGTTTPPGPAGRDAVPPPADGDGSAPVADQALSGPLGEGGAAAPLGEQTAAAADAGLAPAVLVAALGSYWREYARRSGAEERRRPRGGLA